ncbi:DNA glycosylase [Rhypophila decipiens]|uniref:DNA glycosylase n=1 Tax=Rhypophila decipiens TaxID=261697 RepID=A0AAN6Y3N4_9PEZI|nr:DNA glycosylase [Rhypophila decipiens]
MRTRRTAKLATGEATVDLNSAGSTKNLEISNPEASLAATTRQTRLSFRVSKAQVPVPPSDKLQRQEDVADTVALEPPTKRRRITQSNELASSDSLPVTQEAKVVKAESTPATDTSKPAVRKLLVIKGLVTKDGISQKVAAAIEVDTTQILDPDFKMQIKRGPSNPSGLTPGFSPYIYRKQPTPEACEEVYRILAQAHGEVKPPGVIPPASLEVAGCGEVPCLMDALVRTLISGNTMMPLANKAIQNVAKHYGVSELGTGAGSINWDKVRLGSHEELVGQVKVAGSGPTKAKNMKTILDMVYQENLEMMPKGAPRGPVVLALDHLRHMSKDDALARLVAYPGIGIKTAACVTLFCLQIPVWAVDTHVLRFCQWLGWVPHRADADNCFRHGDVKVPDHLKYGLHQLFIRHGQQCFKCRKATRAGTKEWREAPDCPLEHLLDRRKDGNEVAEEA